MWPPWRNAVASDPQPVQCDRDQQRICVSAIDRRNSDDSLLINGYDMTPPFKWVSTEYCLKITLLTKTQQDNAFRFLVILLQYNPHQRQMPMVYPDSSDDDSVVQAAPIPVSFAVLD